MRKIFLFVIMAVGTLPVLAQSKTTEALQKNYKSQAFFFYNNTLRMINQKEDPELDAIIKDIEKMKVLIIDKQGKAVDYKNIVADYKGETFEEIMSSRHQGKNFDVYVKEKGNKTVAMLALINDETSLMVFDIVGSISLNKVNKLYDKLDESSEIGKRIKEFTGSRD